MKQKLKSLDSTRYGKRKKIVLYTPQTINGKAIRVIVRSTRISSRLYDKILTQEDKDIDKTVNSLKKYIRY